MSEQPTKRSPIEELLDNKERLKIQEMLVLEKAFKSNDVEQILKAQNYVQHIEKREKTENKSILIDPMDLYSSFGYKEKPYALSYDMLRAMAKIHIIKAIIETRKEQVQKFTQPQKDKYSPGFIIQKRTKLTGEKKVVKLSKEEQQRVEDMIEFLLNCGNTENFWHGDTFDTFCSKIIQDSLSLDQGTFECVRNRKGELIEFFATDGATYRVADSYDDDSRGKNSKELEVKGYTPNVVQLYQNRIVAEFYPWELGFCVRNPTTDIRTVGYGRSELEDSVKEITAILNADSFNANFFKVGSSPRGIIKYTGAINQNTVEDFRKQWIAQVSGVANAHKIPMINAEKMDFISTAISNKDMEFSKYQEFLIKILCAMYKIDPSEIGFPMSGNSEGGNPMFGGDNKERLQFSKDKGLKPLLKKLEYWINKWIIWQLDPSYEFRFVGMDEEVDRKTELEEDVQKLQNFQTVNEIRAKYNLDDIEGGDIILNPTFVSSQQQAQMGNQESNDYMTNQFGDQSNPFTGNGNDDTGGEGKDQGKNNPFIKALTNDLPKILS